MEQVLSLGAALRRHRLANGMSQEALAERAGLSVEAIGAIERGQRRPRSSTLRSLGLALGLSPVQIGSLQVALRRTGRPRSAPPPPGLPGYRTAIIGRTHELAVVSYLLRVAGIRLITLTGVGGVGKTRVAIQAAIEAVDAFPDGVVWIDLASVRDPALVEATIAQGLGLRDEGKTPLRARLQASLRKRQVLLVLDNFEQVFPARDLLASLLATCPLLSIVVTSRTTLRLAGEQEYPIMPLSLPGPGETRVAAISESPAVALFMQRAQAVLPTTRLTERTAPLIARICRRLDGLPLALELAAAMVQVLPPQEMAAQIGVADQPAIPDATTVPPSLDLLEQGAWELPDRQQSVRQSIAWSYQLLEAQEQRVFLHLAVFNGGWDEVAAVAVADPEAEDDMGAVLSRLVIKNLIRRVEDPGRTPRFGMLETIREYAAENLEEHAGADAVHARHASYFLALAENGNAAIAGRDESQWLDRLEQEHDNLRDALRRYTRDAAAESVRLAGLLWRFWHIRGYRTEGRAWLRQVLQRSPGAPVAWRALALHGAGSLAHALGDHADARASIEQALALRRTIADSEGIAESLHGLARVLLYIGDHSAATTLFVESLAMRRIHNDAIGVADTLSVLGNLAWENGDYDQSQTLHEEALALRHAAGDRRGIATALGNLGIVAQARGNPAMARQLYEEGLAIHRALGDREGVARGVHNLGDVTLEQEDYERAAPLLQEAARLWSEVGHTFGQVYSLNNLGNLALQQGDHLQAAKYFRESLEIGREINYKRSVADALECIAILLSRQGEAHRATRLFGAAAALRDSGGAARWPQALSAYAGGVAQARLTLGEDVFTAVWATGASMDLKAAIDEALASAAVPPHEGRITARADA